MLYQITPGSLGIMVRSSSVQRAGWVKVVVTYRSAAVPVGSSDAIRGAALGVAAEVDALENTAQEVDVLLGASDEEVGVRPDTSSGIVESSICSFRIFPLTKPIS